MKHFKIALTLAAFILLFSVRSMAQEGMEDVLYLKNGNVYRGIIIEQIPAVSMKIQTIGGNVYNVAIADVAKITKENKIMPEGAGAGPDGPGRYDHFEHHDFGHMGPGQFFHRDRFYGMDSFHRQSFHYRNKGYFFQGQILFQYVQGGLHIINGYKFGPRGYLGVGIGFDMVYRSINRGRDLSGTYLPLFLQYSGDILKKRITPFYSIEAGYALAYDKGRGFDNFNGSGSEMRGGMIGGVGFGVKFFGHNRANLSISMNMDAKNVRYKEYINTYDPAGNLILTSRMTSAMLLLPGIKLGFGF